VGAFGTHVNSTGYNGAAVLDASHQAIHVIIVVAVNIQKC